MLAQLSSNPDSGFLNADRPKRGKTYRRTATHGCHINPGAPWEQGDLTSEKYVHLTAEKYLHMYMLILMVID